MQNIDILNNLFLDAVKTAIDKELLTIDNFENIDCGLERPRDEKNGDFACTLAMRLTKIAKKNPREIAQIIIDCFPENDVIDSLEIAGPGFINVRLSNLSAFNIINSIRERGYGFAKDCLKGSIPTDQSRVNIEYISANPTGPMHVGHGR